MKKAQSMSQWTMYLILGVSLMVLLMYFAPLSGQVIDRSVKPTTCKASVYANAARLANGLDFAQSNIRCPPGELVISSKDDEGIYSALANASYTCWDNFGQGRLSLFDVSRGGKGYFCVICDYVSFEGDARGHKLSGYPYYLMTHHIPHNSKTYYEFLSGKKPTPGDIVKANSIGGYLDTNQSYVILFVYAKKKGYWDTLSAAIGGTGGFLAGVSGAVALALSPFTFGGSAYAYIISLGLIGGGAVGANLGPLVSTEWSAGIELVPFTSQSLVEQRCYRLEQ